VTHSLSPETRVRPSGSLTQWGAGLGALVVAVWVIALSYAELTGEVRGIAVDVARLERGLSVCCGYASTTARP
jgi:hypothetical protein